MSDGAGYDRVYRRVLGIGLLVSRVVHGAILAWGSLNLTPAASDDPAEATTQLALAFVDEQPIGTHLDEWELFQSLQRIPRS